MTGSLKRHPSEEPDESPKAKRRESPSTAEPSTALTEASTEGSPTTDAKEDTAPAPPSFLSPPTKIGGVSITEKVGISADKGKLNGNGTSILSSGFSLATSTSLFSPSNGSSFGSSSNGTNIFAAALSNVGTGGGIFGAASKSSSSGFVFGGNMTDRVVAPAAPKETEKTSSETSETPEKSDTGDKEKEEETAEGSGDTADSNKVSLKELEMTSGEEDERRVLQTSCKLYQFCPVGKKWIERGRGTLRLNEKEQDGVVTSRLVIRSKAVMKVMLNTKIFADMVVNRANLTTIRISALDEGKMATFLLKCARNECDKLHTVLLKKRENERHKVGETPTVEKKPSQEIQTAPATNPPPIISQPTPSSSEPATASDTTETEEKTEEVKVASDDKKSEEAEASDEKLSDESVVSEAPVCSSEKSIDSSIAVSDSENTVNGAKSEGVSDVASKPETPLVSIEEPEKSDS
ncbi:hypothetical protein ACHWQZ_G011454 [Mnemiopsis leidyi]